MRCFQRLFCILTAFALIFLIFLSATPAVFAQNKQFNWYFKTAPDHKQPLVFDGQKFPDEYGALYLGPEGDRTVYLTFDAGYENGNVVRILDTLRAHDAPAAFFILPALVRSNPELIVRMQEEGHTVCNHSTTHHNMAQIASLDEFRTETETLEKLCFEQTGVTMAKYFRPPEGTFSVEMLDFCRQLGQTPVFWSFAYADWDNNNQPSPEEAFLKITANAHDGMVLLLHPTSATNAAVLDRVLCWFEENGYAFGTLDQLYEKTAANNTALQSLREYEEKGWLIQNVSAAGKTVALTFDDGPHPALTDEILDILAEYGVKATFFVLGCNISAAPETVRRAIAEGHEIGNHTWTHCYLPKTSCDAYLADIAKTQTLLAAEYDYCCKVFRPPGGFRSAEAIERVHAMGMRYVLWSWKLDTRDWASPPAEQVVHTVLDNIEGGDIVLCHDYIVHNSPTPQALKEILPALLAQGYSFATVSELCAAGERAQSDTPQCLPAQKPTQSAKPTERLSVRTAR